MSREEFIKILEENKYLFILKNDKLVINHKGSVYLESLEILPNKTIFKNKGSVYLESLEILPNKTIFKNKGTVYLISLEILPNKTIFKNKGSVYLESLEILKTKTLKQNNLLFSKIIGSRDLNTTYNFKKDIIYCGCFTGNLDEFNNKVLETYPDENSKHHKDYLEFIKECKIIKSN